MEWSHSWQYASREIETSLSLLEANRKHILELLRKVPGSLSRKVIIEWLGGDLQEVNIGWVLEMQTNHVTRHVEGIRITSMKVLQLSRNKITKEHE
jgi:hypothetical protein